MNKPQCNVRNRFIKREAAFDADDDADEDEGTQTSKSTDASKDIIRNIHSNSFRTDEDPVRNSTSKASIDPSKDPSKPGLGIDHQPLSKVSQVAGGQKWQGFRKTHYPRDSSFSSCSDRSFSFDEQRSSISSLGDSTSKRSLLLSSPGVSQSETPFPETSSTLSSVPYRRSPYEVHLSSRNHPRQTIDTSRPPVNAKLSRSLNQDDWSKRNRHTTALEKPYRSCDAVQIANNASVEQALTEKHVAVPGSNSKVRSMRKLFEGGTALPPPSPEKWSPFLSRRTMQFRETRKSASVETVMIDDSSNEANASIYTKQKLHSLPGNIEGGGGQKTLTRHSSCDAISQKAETLGPDVRTPSTESAKNVKARSKTAEILPMQRISSLHQQPQKQTTAQDSTLSVIGEKTTSTDDRPVKANNFNHIAHADDKPVKTGNYNLIFHADDKPVKADDSKFLIPTTSKTTQRSATLPKTFGHTCSVFVRTPPARALFKTTSKSEEDLTKHRPIAFQGQPNLVPLVKQSPEIHSSTAMANLRKTFQTPANSTVPTTLSRGHCTPTQSVTKESRTVFQTTEPISVLPQKQEFSSSSYIEPKISTTSSFSRSTFSTCAPSSAPSCGIKLITSTVSSQIAPISSPIIAAASAVQPTIIASVSCTLSQAVPVSIFTASYASSAAAAKLGDTTTSLTAKVRPVSISPSDVKRASFFNQSTKQATSSVSLMTSPPCVSSSTCVASTPAITTNANTSTPTVLSSYRSTTKLTLAKANPIKGKVVDGCLTTKRSASSEDTSAIGRQSKTEDTIHRARGISVDSSITSRKSAHFTPHPVAESEKEHRQELICCNKEPTSTSDLPQFRALPIAAAKNLNLEIQSQSAALENPQSTDILETKSPAHLAQNLSLANFQKGLERLTKAAVNYIPEVLTSVVHRSDKTLCLRPCDTTLSSETKGISSKTEEATDSRPINDEMEMTGSLPMNAELLTKGQDESVAESVTMVLENMAEGEKCSKVEEKTSQQPQAEDDSYHSDFYECKTMLPLPKHSVIMRNRWRRQKKHLSGSIISSSNSSSSSSSSSEDAGRESVLRSRRQSRSRRSKKILRDPASASSAP